MASEIQLLTALSLILSACSAEPQAPRTQKADQRPGSARTVTSLAEIDGPWDIVRFGDHRPTRLGTEGLRRAYVNIHPRGLGYTIECNYSGNRAHIDWSGVLHDESGGSRISTLMGCGPELEARDKAFFGFFATRPKVTLSREGRLQISNDKTELILERPEVRRLANIPPLEEIIGQWRPGMAMKVSEMGGHEGWGFLEPTTLTIARHRITFSGCGGAAFTFHYTEDARIVTSGNTRSQCGTDTPGLILLNVLRNDPLVERTKGGGIALQAGDQVVSLQNEEELRRLRENPPPSPPVVATPPPPPPPPLPPPRPKTSNSGVRGKGDVTAASD